MKIYIVGNSMVQEDSLPYALLPILRKRFPRVIFEEADPNENFVPEEGSIILDSVVDIEDVRFFDNLDAFIVTRSISPHDYDLGFHLQLLRKMHRITSIAILGLPQKHLTDGIQRDVIAAIERAGGDITA
jgi:hypothetical protein